MLSLTIIFSGGCATYDKDGKKFKREMDSTIGLGLNESHMHGSPTKVIDIDKAKQEYQYGSEKTGCEWAYVVNRKTLVIESWKYISEPEKCYLWVNWRGPF